MITGNEGVCNSITIPIITVFTKYLQNVIFGFICVLVHIHGLLYMLQLSTLLSLSISLTLHNVIM